MSLAQPLLGFADDSIVLSALIVLTGIASGVLAAVGLVALSRRRTTPYLLVALALVFLAAKAVVAGFYLGGFLDVSSHNFLEHALDFGVATLLIAAILEARNPYGCTLGRWFRSGTE